MQTNLQVFQNVEFGKVRMLEIDGKPYFVANDIAKALGYALPRKAIFDHCKGVLKWNALTNGGKQTMNIIPEGDVYRLIIHSKLPSAELFERWVFDDVLPTLRQTGEYKQTLSPVEEMARGLLAAQKILEEKEAKIKELEPKGEFYDAVAKSDTLFSMQQAAKVLNVGRNKLFAYLRKQGILDSQNLPYQRYIDAGYFKVCESYYTRGERNIVFCTTYVKQRGLDYIRKMIERSATFWD